MHTVTPNPFWQRPAYLFLFGALVFALVYGQAPLYYSNQNQYFLHGLADAGHGFLADDWLAGTADPTPVFTLLVSATARFLHPWFFHLYYAVLLGIYLASMVLIFAYLAREWDTPRVRLAFVALLLLTHSALARWAVFRIFGLDYFCYLQGWLAGQYVLGPVFQPSTFGVLLILAIHLFLEDRPFAAVFSACLGATIHSTYLLGAAMLTLGFLVVVWGEEGWRRALLLGGWALALVTPVTLYTILTFRPTSAEAFAESQAILVYTRIPHHCLPELWCDGIAMAQIAWMLLAIFLVRGTRLFPVLGVPFVAGAALTLLQIATQNDTLALLFPWRFSVILIPIATAVILSRIVMSAAWFDTVAVGVAGDALVLALAVAGLTIMVTRQGFPSNPDEEALLEFVTTSKAKGDVYLLPIQIPNLKKTTRGSLSSDFKPVAAKAQDSRLIPVDLQRFRLATGAPIFVDFKSVPYKDTDVLEWHTRLLQNKRWYEQLGDAVWDELRQRGITHVVLTADRDLAGSRLELVHEDRAYRVYRLPR